MVRTHTLRGGGGHRRLLPRCHLPVPTTSLCPIDHPHLQPAQESLDSPIDRRSDYYRRSALAQQGVAGRKPQPQPLMTLPNMCAPGALQVGMPAPAARQHRQSAAACRAAALPCWTHLPPPTTHAAQQPSPPQLHLCPRGPGAGVRAAVAHGTRVCIHRHRLCVHPGGSHRLAGRLPCAAGEAHGGVELIVLLFDQCEGMFTVSLFMPACCCCP